MESYPPAPDDPGSLTPRERRILLDIEHEFRASEALLEIALTDGVLPLASWLLWMGRVALILIPLVLLLPFSWWSSIVTLAATFAMFKLATAPHRRGAEA